MEWQPPLFRLFTRPVFARFRVFGGQNFEQEEMKFEDLMLEAARILSLKS